MLLKKWQPFCHFFHSKSDLQNVQFSNGSGFRMVGFWIPTVPDLSSIQMVTAHWGLSICNKWASLFTRWGLARGVCWAWRVRIWRRGARRGRIWRIVTGHVWSSVTRKVNSWWYSGRRGCRGRRGFLRRDGSRNNWKIKKLPLLFML